MEIILLCIGLFLAWFILLVIGRELVFITINKSIIRVRRPLLKTSPFRKDRPFVEIPISEITEINITKKRWKGPVEWRFISCEKKELLKIHFEPEYIFSTVELDDYFQKNGIEIKLT